MLMQTTVFQLPALSIRSFLFSITDIRTFKINKTFNNDKYTTCICRQKKGANSRWLENPNGIRKERTEKKINEIRKLFLRNDQFGRHFTMKMSLILRERGEKACESDSKRKSV